MSVNTRTLEKKQQNTVSSHDLSHEYPTVYSYEEDVAVWLQKGNVLDDIIRGGKYIDNTQIYENNIYNLVTCELTHRFKPQG